MNLLSSKEVFSSTLTIFLFHRIILKHDFFYRKKKIILFLLIHSNIICFRFQITVQVINQYQTVDCNNFHQWEIFLIIIYIHRLYIVTFPLPGERKKSNKIACCILYKTKFFHLLYLFTAIFVHFNQI